MFPPCPEQRLTQLTLPSNWATKILFLIDTVGLRRRGKIAQGVEHYGVLRSLKAISGSDVACLMLDYGTGLTNQDLHVSQYILDAGKGLIIAVNKTDLMTNHETEQKKFLDLLSYRIPYMPWAPVLFVSAIKKKTYSKFLNLLKISRKKGKKNSRQCFENIYRATVDAHPLMRSGKNITITKGEQTGICPPTFTFYTNHPDLIHFRTADFGKRNPQKI